MKTDKEWTIEQGFCDSKKYGLHGYVEFEAEEFCELVKRIQLDALEQLMPSEQPPKQ